MCVHLGHSVGTPGVVRVRLGALRAAFGGTFWGLLDFSSKKGLSGIRLPGKIKIIVTERINVV